MFRSVACYASLVALVLLAQPLHAQSPCDPVPPAVLSLSIESRYAGSSDTRDTVNRETGAEADEALKPIDDFLRDLSGELDALLKLPMGDRREKANCLIRRVAEWARADALSDQGSETTRLTIGARLAGFAIMSGRAAPFATDYTAIAETRDWLGRRIAEQMRFWEEAPRGAASGNLRAWAALAAAATAELTDDDITRAWAVWSTAYVLCSANPDGSLPQEMTRGRLALHYQLHALAPLATSVLLLERQGVSMMGLCDNALSRAARFALDDLETGAATRAITGVEQSFFDGSAELQGFQLAWLEAYLLLDPSPALAQRVADLRPLSFSKLGGNQSLIWAP